MHANRLWFWLGLAVFALGCKPTVKTVTVTPPMTKLDSQGATATLSASAVDKDGKPVEGAVLTWASAQPGVATVEGGKVTALSSGLANITATAGDVTGSAQVRVSIPSKIDLKPPAVELTGVGIRAGVLVTVLDDLGATVLGLPLTWTSSDPMVVEIQDGQLMTTGPGAAKISITGGGMSAELPVTVKLPEVATLTVEPASVALASSGETAALTALPVDAAGQPVLGVPLTWVSSSEKVATMGPKGMVTAVGKGTAKISVTTGKLKAEATVTVKK
jgi:uncharacterized protein YjdB